MHVAMYVAIYVSVKIAYISLQKGVKFPRISHVQF